MQEVLLEGRGDGRLARRGEARQPEGDAALAAELGALGAGEGRVPGDVAGGIIASSDFVYLRDGAHVTGDCGVGGEGQHVSTYVAIAPEVCVIGKKVWMGRRKRGDLNCERGENWIVELSCLEM